MPAEAEQLMFFFAWLPLQGTAGVPFGAQEEFDDDEEEEEEEEDALMDEEGVSGWTLVEVVL